MESYIIDDEPQLPINGSFEEFRAILDELTSLGVSIGEKYGGGKGDKGKLRPFSAISEDELYKVRGGVEQSEEEEKEEKEEEEPQEEDEKKILKSLLSDEDNVEEPQPNTNINDNNDIKGINKIDISSFLEAKEGSFDINDAII